ncbi:MAG: non-homologous end-joining DNA ligase [Phycisphaerales bacterium]|nr:non-homologous end-joining DNA ligase [Phycisphaerales bacterium]
MSLEEYRRKRDFERTPEPAADSKRGKRKRSGPLGYATQKHSATRLHYDLRLEHDGVLLSWALPKGPSMDPREKKLAVQTEDHPLAYGGFEGLIPAGEYGGGTVMLWDRGEWEPLSPMPQSYLDGDMKVLLRGMKLRGAWALVRMKGKGNESGKNWLFIKERDEFAAPEEAYSVIDEEPFSALTARSMHEISTAADNVWRDGQAVGEAPLMWRKRRSPATVEAQLDIEALPGARAADMPKLTPIRAAPADAPPTGDDWLHEIWIRGVRLLATLTDTEVRLIGMEGEDWTTTLPGLARKLSNVPAHSAILDGVATVMGAGGKPNLPALELAMRLGDERDVVFHAFDMPYANGIELRATPILERKTALKTLIEAMPADAGVTYSDHIIGHGAEVFAQAGKLGAAGVVSKRFDSGYTAPNGKGDQPTWVESQCVAAETNKTANQGGAGILPANSHLARRAQGATAAEAVWFFHDVRFTNPDRILYPEQRVTKRALAEYYERVADLILPHIIKRPLSLYRCPQGIEHEAFFQKHLGEMSTPHIREAPVRKDEGREPYVAIDGLEGLLTLAQLSVLEIHPWGSREDNVDKPDLLVLDLDPGPGVDWAQIVECAIVTRETLESVKLRGFVKTSGGKGLHIVVPITRRHGWDVIKTFCANVAKAVAKRDEKRYTANIAKWAREKRVFVDYLRNVRGATCVAPYSTRARPGAMVSTPLTWDELDAARPLAFNVETLPLRLDAIDADPWADFFDRKQSLTADAQRKLAP